MRKTALLSAALLLGGIAFTQPNMFVAGPAYYFGSGNFQNLAFSRSYSMDANGNPVNTFSNLQSSKFSSSAVGFLLEVNKKHFHMGMDLAFPLKGKLKTVSGTARTGTVINLALAWGGYIKEKVGILVGLSGTGNASSFSPDISSLAGAAVTPYEKASLGMDYTKSGNYYMDTYHGGALGIDGHLTYAINEQFIARISYTKFVTGLKMKESNMATEHKLDDKINGSRIEAGLFYQMNENFGFFARYTLNSVKSTVYSKGPYTNPSTQTKNDASILIFPDQKMKLGIVAVGVMVPPSWFGSREYQGGRISASSVEKKYKRQIAKFF